MTPPQTTSNQHADAVFQPFAEQSSHRRWPVHLTWLVCGYYAVSAVTLPFVNKLWLGELPLLSLFQLPKAVLKSGFQTILLRGVDLLGLSQGSASPDYIATHWPAMGLMAAVPALLVVLALWLPRGIAARRQLILAVLSFALIDAVVTMTFDLNSQLKMFNGSYF